MARVPRSLVVLAGFAVHKVWRGHNREFNLGEESDKNFYMSVYNEDCASTRYESGAELQALTLMSNHSHEVYLVSDQELFSEQMRRHHGRYGLAFNKKYERCGKVAQDRPHTTLLENDEQQMRTVFYIHANPIRAGLVRDVRNYDWSTHKLYAFGKRLPWMKNVRLPQWYKKLGKTVALRQRNYRSLFAKYLRESGRTKQTFLKKHFLGSFAWTKKHELAVSRWRKTHAPPD